MSKHTNKGVAWLYNEVCALLDIWADQEIQQQLAGRLHNMCVYEKISKKLADLGIHRSGEQCREKIKKLRRDYKTVVDNNYSPAFARKMLGCYDKAHEIFGKCTVVKPSFVIESIIYNENISHTNKEVESDKSDLQAIKKCSMSESEQPELTINEQNDKHDSVDKIQTDATERKKMMTDSLDIMHIDTIGIQKFKTNILETSNMSISKSQTNFQKAFESLKLKHSKSKTDWNTFKMRIERRLDKQKFLHSKILKRQALLHSRFIHLERKKFVNEIEQEHHRLHMLETKRQKHNEQEINLFKSLLQTMAEKQGIKLSLQDEH